MVLPLFLLVVSVLADSQRGIEGGRSVKESGEGREGDVRKRRQS
jgi:hypothetical protein